MTNKEAIEVLRKINLCVPTGVIEPSDFYLALALAIQALEETQGDLISREALKKEIERTFDMQDLYLPVHFLDLIDNAPTVDIKDEIAGAYNEGYMCGNKEAEKGRPQGDLISREVLKGLISDKSIPIKFEEEKRGDWRCSLGMPLKDIYKIIDNAPAISPYKAIHDELHKGEKE